MYIYVNGDYVKADQARISPFDHGFLYGLGLFETFRTYDRHPFLLEEHVARMNQGLKTMSIDVTLTAKEVMEIVQKLSEMNKLENAYFRLNVSAGVGEIGLTTEPYTLPTIILFQKELPQMEALKEKEANILAIRRNTPETEIRLKSHHFFNNIAAKREMGSHPNREGIFLNSEGFLAEGITSNLFWVIGNTLYTPSIDTGILNGITRQFIIEIANQCSLTVEEGLYEASVLQDAEEIFFTNSIQEISPVNRLGEKNLPGKDGKYVNLLHRQYQKEIKKMQSH